MADVSSFPPLLTPHAHTLILGSMPGVRSLTAQEYYAHGRNQFWPLMCDIFGVAPLVAYADKVALMAENRIAVWDVLAQCVRPGSLDADIRNEKANDFAALFAKQPSIAHVFFNGRKAEESFHRLVLPFLSSGVVARLSFVTLPSTSPANASFSYARKREAWNAIAEAVQKAPAE